MTESTRSGIAVCVAAASLGVLTDLLLHTGPRGLNVPLWLATAATVLFALSRRVRVLPRYGPSALVAAVLAAAVLAWRDSAILRALSAATSLAFLMLSVRRTSASRDSRMCDLIHGGAVAAAGTAAGAAVLVAADVDWREVCSNGVRSRVRAVARGAAIGISLAAIFGALFFSADAIFQQLARRLLDVDPAVLGAHVAVVAAGAWLTAGYMRSVLIREDPDDHRDAPWHTASRLGHVDLLTAIGIVDVLFVAFAAIQIRYLFAGADLVQRTAGMTYASYARRGFFELAIAAPLALVALVILDAVRDRSRSGPELWFRSLAALQVPCVGVIIASAMRRMTLYQQAYGQTELRFYTMAFMAWVSVLFACLVATTLRGRPDRFGPCAMATLAAAIGLLCVVNPDARVAKSNVERAARTGHFDAAYAATLSADAVPDLERGLARLAPLDRARMEAALRARWNNDGRDWRTWNLDRAAAAHAVNAMTRGDGGYIGWRAALR